MHDGNFLRRNGDQEDTIRLNALLFATPEDSLDRMIFVQQLAPQAEPAGPPCR
jgi:hypothetical protein